MKQLVTLLILILALTSCDRVREGTKKTINAGGEVVGKTATEFIEGVTEGVDRTLQCELSISESLKADGLETGKFTIQSDTVGGQNNLLTLYIIFNRDFNKSILVKAFDKAGLEVGRVKLPVDGKAGDAKYYDFLFDKRTYIEVKSKLTIE